MSWYTRHRRNVYSQNGEDGVLAAILDELGIAEGRFVDVGAMPWGNGGSNTWALLNRGWSGVMIDRNPDSEYFFGEMTRQFGSKVACLIREIDGLAGNTIDDVLSSIGWPQSFDLLTIDIEEPTYHAWRDMVRYRPTVAVIEIASRYAPGKRVVDQNYCGTWIGEKVKHASWTDMVELARHKGYSPVCHIGNVIFVENGSLHKLSMPPAHLQNPDLLWSDEWWGAGPAFTEVARP